MTQLLGSFFPIFELKPMRREELNGLVVVGIQRRVQERNVVIEVFWSNPWLNRVLLPCFLQISKIFVDDDSLYSLDSPVIPCSQLSYSDHSPGPHYHDHSQIPNSKAIPRHFTGDYQVSNLAFHV